MYPDFTVTQKSKLSIAWALGGTHVTMCQLLKDTIYETEEGSSQITSEICIYFEGFPETHFLNWVIFKQHGEITP